MRGEKAARLRVRNVCYFLFYIFYLNNGGLYEKDDVSVYAGGAGSCGVRYGERGRRQSSADDLPGGAEHDRGRHDYAHAGQSGGGAIALITVTPEEGFRLKEGSLKVNDDPGAVRGSFPSYFLTMPATHVTVKAEFEELPENTHLISIGIFANGTVSGPDSAEHGAEVALTSNAAAGYRLAEGGLTVTQAGGGIVSGTLSGNTYTFTMPAANVTVQAVFTAGSAMILLPAALSPILTHPCWGHGKTSRRGLGRPVMC
jgi:hypothetical protein